MVANVRPFRQKSSNSSLGIYAKSASTNLQFGHVPKVPKNVYPDESPTEYRFRLQSLARELLGSRDKRIDGCLRRPLPFSGHVEVARNPDTNSAHYRGLEQCNRVWTCPVCSARISNERRKELSAALAAAKHRGYFPIMVTYTLRHTHEDSLDCVLAGLQGALRLFKSGSGYQTIKDEFSVIGGIRALEITYGKNGWHPHIHELLFLESPLSDSQIRGLKHWLADRWIYTLNKLGFDASYEHGLDVRTANSDIADYIAKYGREPKEVSWQVEHEIARAPNKRAHGDGLTPFQLLEAYEDADFVAGDLFREYALVMKGKHQLVWSSGLRDLLQLPPGLEDEQLPLFEETPTTYTVITIGIRAWERACFFDLRAEILLLAGKGDVDSLRKLFERYKIDALIHDPPSENSKCDEQLATPVHEPTFKAALLPNMPASKAVLR